jgi:hypothetical protein
VLFSSADVAKQINESFEPAWESVRAVPIVTIDFGNGEKITRTLHGNIATYVCTADGKVIDLLPGLYSPDVYVQRLSGMARLHALVKSASPEALANTLRTYHTLRIETLKDVQSAISKLRVADMRKADIEGPVKRVAWSQSATAPIGSVAPESLRTAERVAGATVLAEDTRVNETARRLQIHTLLAERGPATPNEIVKWLYKEVLHADLDDPYLGLGEVLFKNYAFAEEEARR